MSDEDLLSALASLPSLDAYTPDDKYRDFKKVFSTDEGKRVFTEILSWGHLLQPAVYGKPIDPYQTHVRDGEANIARKLLVTFLREPKEQPQMQTRKQTR